MAVTEVTDDPQELPDGERAPARSTLTSASSSAPVRRTVT